MVLLTTVVVVIFHFVTTAANESPCEVCINAGKIFCIIDKSDFCFTTMHFGIECQVVEVVEDCNDQSLMWWDIPVGGLPLWIWIASTAGMTVILLCSCTCCFFSCAMQCNRWWSRDGTGTTRSLANQGDVESVGLSTFNYTHPSPSFPVRRTSSLKSGPRSRPRCIGPQPSTLPPRCPRSPLQCPSRTPPPRRPYSTTDVGDLQEGIGDETPYMFNWSPSSGIFSSQGRRPALDERHAL